MTAPPHDSSDDDAQRSSPNGFLQRYSPHGELPKSSLSSCILHMLAVLLIGLLAGVTAKQELLPPGVDVIIVGDEPTAAADIGDGLPPGGEALEQTKPEMKTEPASLTKADEVKKLDEVVPDMVADVGKKVADLSRTSAAAAADQARSSLDDAKKRLAQNLGGGTGGGGGSGPKGRAARQARWIIHFRSRSGQDYLAQLQGLGAEVAVPDRNGMFRFFSNLTGRPPTSRLGDLASENRMFWEPERTASTDAILQILGLPAGTDLIFFLPAATEAKMLKLELAYANLREEDIASTVYDCVSRGSSYDVIVSHQTPR